MNVVDRLNGASADLLDRLNKEPIPNPPTANLSAPRAGGVRPSWLAGVAAFVVVAAVGALLGGLLESGTSSPPTGSGSEPSPSSSQALTTLPGGPTDATPFDTGPLRPRDGHSVVWTGSELIVWGGAATDQDDILFADGAAFDPASDTWRPIAQAPIPPRQGHHAAWTGEEMLIVGGLGHSDGAAYDPNTDRWRLLPATPIPTTSPAPIISQYTSSVWTGQELVMWNVSSDTLAAYSPQTDTWRTLTPVQLGAAAGVLRWNGESIYVFGIEAFAPNVNELFLARLDTEGWVRLPDLTITTPTPMLSAWIDGGFTVWNDDGQSYSYEPGQTIWRPRDPIPIDACEGVGEPLELDGSLLVFGWCGDDALYDAASGDWSTVRLPGLGRGAHAVWTGDEVLVWGDVYGDPDDPSAVIAWRLAVPPA